MLATRLSCSGAPSVADISRTACALVIEAPAVLSGTPDFEVTQSCPTTIETHRHRQGAGAAI